MLACLRTKDAEMAVFHPAPKGFGANPRSQRHSRLKVADTVFALNPREIGFAARTVVRVANPHRP